MDKIQLNPWLLHRQHFELGRQANMIFKTTTYFQNSLFSPMPQHKLRLLVLTLRGAPKVDKLVLQTTMTPSLFHTERNLSKIFWKNNIYSTGIFKFLPLMPLVKGIVSLYLNGPCFLMPIRCFHSLLSPPRRKKLSFKFSIGKNWKKKKAFKSGLTEDASCLRCEETEIMEHHIYVCENYSAKICHLAGQSFTFTISRHSGDYILNIDLTPVRQS